MTPELAHRIDQVDSVVMGQRLRAARRARGMTQAEVAVACELSTAYISRLETGGRRAAPPLLERLAEALEVTPEQLAGPAVSETMPGMDAISVDDVDYKFGVAQVLVPTALLEDFESWLAARGLQLSRLPGRLPASCDLRRQVTLVRRFARCLLRSLGLACPPLLEH